MAQVNALGLGLQDGDPLIQDYAGGAIRLRYYPPTQVTLLQVSADNGDGTFSVTTFTMPPGTMSPRGTVQSDVEWPEYPPPERNPLSE